MPTVLTRAMGFKESPEYQEMRSYELDIPGVVGGAFAKYLTRVHSEGRAHELIVSAHQVLDVLASSQDRAVQNLVSDEIFENLEADEQVLADIEAHLLPNALSLYKLWRAGRPGTQ